MNEPLILASASPRRLELLAQIGVTPSQIVAPSIDETPYKSERPTLYVTRIAREKVQAIIAQHPNARILCADTAVACGRRILPKAEDEATARHCLELLSGRRHRVYTAVAFVSHGRMHEKLVMTQVQFKCLEEKEIAEYLASREWHGKAGGYAIQGIAAGFIPWIAGSYSNVVGLPLYETQQLLSR